MGVVICNNCKRFWWENKGKCKCSSTTFTPAHDVNRNFISWVCTDPDNHQYGRQIGDTIFEFKEKDPMGHWPEMVIDLKSYTETQQEHFVSGYYTNLQEVFDEYGDFADWIIAECIFEQKSGLY